MIYTLNWQLGVQVLAIYLLCLINERNLTAVQELFEFVNRVFAMERLPSDIMCAEDAAFAIALKKLLFRGKCMGLVYTLPTNIRKFATNRYPGFKKVFSGFIPEPQYRNAVPNVVITADSTYAIKWRVLIMRRQLELFARETERDRSDDIRSEKVQGLMRRGRRIVLGGSGDIVPGEGLTEAKTDKITPSKPKPSGAPAAPADLAEESRSEVHASGSGGPSTAFAGSSRIDRGGTSTTPATALSGLGLEPEMKSNRAERRILRRLERERMLQDFINESNEGELAAEGSSRVEDCREEEVWAEISEMAQVGKAPIASSSGPKWAHIGDSDDEKDLRDMGGLLNPEAEIDELAESSDEEAPVATMPLSATTSSPSMATVVPSGTSSRTKSGFSHSFRDASPPAKQTSSVTGVNIAVKINRALYDGKNNQGRFSNEESIKDPSEAEASKQSTKAVPRERARVSEAKPSTLPRGRSNKGATPIPGTAAGNDAAGSKARFKNFMAQLDEIKMKTNRTFRPSGTTTSSGLGRPSTATRGRDQSPPGKRRGKTSSTAERLPVGSRGF